MKTTVLCLFLVGCGGNAVAPLLFTDAEAPDAPTTFPQDAPIRPDGGKGVAPSDDAGEPKPEAASPPPDAGRDTGGPVRIDAGEDATPGACTAEACTGFQGTCGAVEYSCAGMVAEYSCGLCPGAGNGPGQTEKACGDNGDLGQCGNVCASVVSGTAGQSNTYAQVCLAAGLPTAWVVPGNCTGTPWEWKSGGPSFRPGGTAGCTTTPYAGDPNHGVPAGAVCCP